MKQFIKLVAVLGFSILLLRPTAPINKKVYASPAPPKTVQVDIPQTVEVPATVEIPVPVPETAPVAVPVMGNCADWVVEAGITEVDAALTLIGRESGCNPCKINGGLVDCTYNGPKAYGIPQSLPANKLASAGLDWQTNPVTQLRWMNSYVTSRYGSFANALSHSYANNWY